MSDTRDIETVMEMSLRELSDICIDPDVLVKLWTIAIGIGIKIGWRQRDEQYHQMFAGHNETTLSN